MAHRIEKRLGSLTGQSPAGSIGYGAGDNDRVEALIQQRLEARAARNWAEADRMRKIIGKKLGKDEFNKHRKHFVEGCSVIIADTWWEQGNMIMYQTQYGTLGVEKDTVDKIINR